MATFLNILGLIFSIVTLVGWVFALIGAFSDELWKGIVGLLCSLYLLYYVAFEYGGDNQTTVVGLYVGGTVASTICFYLAKHVGV
jgi:hypothetical protein